MKTAKKPFVTVLLATYNDALFLSEAIESVLQQTFKDFEFVIINDRSTDDTDRIVAGYKKTDERIIYIRNDKNVGLTENLNRGISISQGELIARIDGDDAWVDKSKLSRQVKYMANNARCGVVGCFADAVDTNDHKLFEIRYPYESSEMKKIMFKHCCLLHSCVVLRKRVLLNVDSYNIKYPYAQDYDLYLKVGKISEFHNIPRKMVKYRINPLGTTQTKYRAQMQEMVDIIKSHRNSYPSYYFGLFLWSLRKLYPFWFRGGVARNIKNKISILYKLSGA